EHEVHDDLVAVELLETLLEGDREQEAREDLGARLHDAQLLQDLAPIAVEPFVLGLIASVARSSIVVARHALTLGHARGGYRVCVATRGQLFDDAVERDAAIGELDW